MIDTIFGFERGDSKTTKVTKVCVFVTGLLSALAFLAYTVTSICMMWHPICD